MRDIFSDDGLHERFWQLLGCVDERDRIYVYRLSDGKATRPAIYKGAPFRELLEFLRDDRGGGDFQVMIRRGEQMLLTGAISIVTRTRREVSARR